MDSAKRANGGRTCIKLNQPSYKESLKPAACVKPWFGLDLNFFCFRVSLVDCKYAKHLPQFLHVKFFSLFWGFCLFLSFFYYLCKCWKFVSPPRNLGFCFCCNLFSLFCSWFCVFFQDNTHCVHFIILFLFFFQFQQLASQIVWMGEFVWTTNAIAHPDIQVLTVT